MSIKNYLNFLKENSDNYQKEVIEVYIQEDYSRIIDTGEIVSLYEVGINSLYTIDRIKKCLNDLKYEPKFMDFSNESDQEEKITALLHLKELAEQGEIYHVIQTGEEWLGINDEGEILLGRGRADDWGTYNENEETWGSGDPDDWVASEGVDKKDVDIPDGHGSITSYTCFSQKNTDVSNPVNEHEGWYSDFELMDSYGEYFFGMKKLY